MKYFFEKIDSYLDIKKCNLCPKNCEVDRTKNFGFCKAPAKIIISSKNIHFGEEPPISGTKGSGTIFLSYCNLYCKYCQNYPISHLGNGNEINIENLAIEMLKLQDKGVHNINFVTPTHYSNQITKSIFLAKQKGLKIPIVWNTSGYESVEVIDFLTKEKIVDIFLVDMKYGYNEIAEKYSLVKNYVEINILAVKQMLKNVGNLLLDKFNIAKKGVIVRHLVLPNNFLNTKKVLDNLIKIVDVKKVYISFMSQYHPAFLSKDFPEISKKLTKKDYEKSLKYLDKKKFKNGWIQLLD